jgi:XRE family aerobic/anaerobic benzoate catabolism transcriptional regulator
VIAVGGGIVTDAQSFALLRRGARTVWLRAAPEDHWQRVIQQGDLRPMADNEQAFADLRRMLAEREALYRQADVVVDTSTQTLAEVVDAAHSGLAGATA